MHLHPHELHKEIQRGRWNPHVDEHRTSCSLFPGRADREFPYADISKFGPKAKSQKEVVNFKKDSYFDEFGPFVHELRRFRVNFDPFPVINSFLYYSNDYQATTTEYSPSPYGANFYVANTSRKNCILQGEDTLTFGTDNPVDQKMFIYGRVISQEDAQIETIQDDLAIRRRGEAVVDVDSQWIQSRPSAIALGEWIVANWGGGVAEFKLSVFGNSL